jgi:hypothetical protein
MAFRRDSNVSDPPKIDIAEIRAAVPELARTKAENKTQTRTDIKNPHLRKTFSMLPELHPDKLLAI